MKPRCWIRSVAMLATACAVPVPSAIADPGVWSTGGITIHGPDRVLRDFCSRDDAGRLWITLPGGVRYELIESTLDPAVSNPGDGAFHPFIEAEVRAALDQVRFPLGAIRTDVFLLPFPRRLGLESAAGLRWILLSPGTRPLSRFQQHAEFVHELGHVVQYALLPDADLARWDVYRRMRGIEDQTRFNAASGHADRPHEIFAEDFRALFGGPLAIHSGSIENPALRPPGEVAGLGSFLLSLSGAPASVHRLAVSPNPARGTVRFASSGAAGTPLELFDPAGRRIATLDPMVLGARLEWTWDGRDATGRRVRSGAYFARLRGESGPAARLIVLP